MRIGNNGKNPFLLIIAINEEPGEIIVDTKQDKELNQSSPSKQSQNKPDF